MGGVGQEIQRTNRPGWPQNMRTGEPAWLKRWTLPSGRSSLKQAQLNQLGYFPGESPPPPILAWFSYITWERHWLLLCNEEQMPQWPPPHQSLRAYRPHPPQVALHIKLGLHLFPFFPCQTFPLSALPQFRCLHIRFIINPQQRSRITPPMSHLTIDLSRGIMLKLQSLMSAVGTALHRTMGNHMKHCQRHPTKVWLPLGVLKNITVRTKPITVVMSLPKMSWEWMQVIPIWN